MKQIRKILKAQEVYFHAHTSALHRYEVDMMNDGQQSRHHDSDAKGTGCHLAAHRSSHHIHICAQLREGMKVDLLTFQNRPHLLHLVWMSTGFCVGGGILKSGTEKVGEWSRKMVFV